jgi:hypothetical protein
MDEQVDRLVKKTWGKWDEMNPPNQLSSAPLRTGIESIPAQRIPSHSYLRMLRPET